MIGLFAVIALVGGTVHPGDGPPVPDATVIVRDGKIAAIGPGLAVPAGAEVIDCRGKIITPGLIDAFTGLGLVDIDLVPASNDTEARGPAIRAANRAVDNFNPDNPAIAIQRAHGITTVLTAPGGGIIAGQAAVYSLVGDAPLRAPAAMVARLGGVAHGARGTALLALREVLDDARVYAKNKAAFEQNRLRKMAASRLDLEALGPVVRGEVPLIVHVERRTDILATLRLGEEFGVKIIIAGGAEAWLAADALAKARVPVILDPSVDAPLDFDRLHSRADAAALLAKAGVPIALSTFATHQVRKLRQWAGNAVRAGLSHDDALRAVTATPAALYGLGDRGVIRAGAVADLVVWSGDPFELLTHAERVIIGGEAVPTRHRQTALFERYRHLPALVSPGGPDR
ncbi:MAG: amidohydrolase family protein [Myxococcales bacterium]|nr:amidohydrolase family protein [Myxococcales bacterium]